MLIKDKSHFIKGMFLAISFLVVLVVMFSPIFHGQNALKAADRLFNSIAKGSTYYIPDLLKKIEPYKGKSIEVTAKFKDKEMAKKAATIFTKNGVTVNGAGTELKVSGDLGKLAVAAVKDSDQLFSNQDREVVAKYGFGGKEALFVWWTALHAIDRDLTKQKKFKEASFLGEVIKKGVEVAYNFYKIEPESARSRAGLLSFALVFYVIYTLWWGIAILFLFEGIGLEMKAGAKKEV